MKKRLKCYPTDGANVCVCVCVSKLFELTKYNVLKDKGKHTFLFTSLIPLYNKDGLLMNTCFCTLNSLITAAKVHKES